jgi:hypothetical protein
MSGYRFLSRAAAAAQIGDSDLRTTLLVDTYDGAAANMEAFRPLNPFTVWDRPVLGVPGTNLRSRSLEAVWQGLKFVDGELDLGQLSSQPRKRPADAERRASRTYRYADSRFLYGTEVVDLVSARFLIYAIAYLELLDRVIPTSLIETLRGVVAGGGEVIFFDWDEGGDITDPSGSFAHSALLAAWFSGNLDGFLFEPAERALSGSHLTQFIFEASARLTRYAPCPTTTRRVS